MIVITAGACIGLGIVYAVLGIFSPRYQKYRGLWVWVVTYLVAGGIWTYAMLQPSFPMRWLSESSLTATTVQMVLFLPPILPMLLVGLYRRHQGKDF